MLCLFNFQIYKYFYRLLSHEYAGAVNPSIIDREIFDVKKNFYLKYPSSVPFL